MSACEQLTEAASGGAAPALRAVDCLTGEAASAAFGRLFGDQGALLPALTILLTLYIAFFALALLTGRSRIGISVLTPRMMTLGLVLTFATSWLAWQQVVWNLALGAPDQLAGILMGTNGPSTTLFADRIDILIAAIAEVGSEGRQATDAQAATAFSPDGLLWLGATLLMLGTVGLLVTVRIAMGVLLATGPVFVVLGLFGATRGLTAGWLRSLVMCALTPLFVVLGGSLVLELAVPVVQALRGMDGSVDPRASMALFLIAAVHCALMVMALKVAGTMVSAWNVFGLANEASGDARNQPAAPAMPSRELIAQPAPASRAMAGSMSAAVIEDRSSPAPGQARHVTRIVDHAPPGPAMPDLPPMRARGIGSRFAMPRSHSLREIAG